MINRPSVRSHARTYVHPHTHTYIHTYIHTYKQTYKQDGGCLDPRHPVTIPPSHDWDMYSVIYQTTITIVIHILA